MLPRIPIENELTEKNLFTIKTPYTISLQLKISILPFRRFRYHRIPVELLGIVQRHQQQSLAVYIPFAIRAEVVEPGNES